jgi:hypothetical protein
MKKLLLLLLAFGLSACAALQPKTVTSSDLDVQGRLIFKANVDSTFEATKQAFAAKGWKLLYEGTEVPRRGFSYFSNSDPISGKSYDRIAWDKTLNSTLPPRKYLQAKTPTSAFSFGAELFVTLFESPENGSVVQVSSSSSQVLEKKKLEAYIDELAALLNEKLQ